MEYTIEKWETFYDEDEALACQQQHKGAEINARSGHGLWLNGEWTYDIPENRPSWTVCWEETVNGIKFDPADLSSIQQFMDTYRDIGFPLWSKNEDAEDVEIIASHEKVVVKTYQHNGWVKVNTYYRDGTCEETLSRRWKEDNE